jgi:hypothetical protein
MPNNEPSDHGFKSQDIKENPKGTFVAFSCVTKDCAWCTEIL